MKLPILFLFFLVTTKPLLGMVEIELGVIEPGAPADTTPSVVEALTKGVAHVTLIESDNTSNSPVCDPGDTKTATPFSIDEKEITEEITKHFMQILQKAKKAQRVHRKRGTVTGAARELLTCIDECFKYASEEPFDVETTVKLVAQSIKDLEIDLTHLSNNMTALHKAAFHDGNIIAVKTLCLAGAKVNDRGDWAEEVKDTNYNPSNQTPLCLAARAGKNEVCKILLEYGARVNYRDQSYSSPLHEAAACGRRDVCETLINARADTSVVDVLGHLPEFYAWGEARDCFCFK